MCTPGKLLSPPVPTESLLRAGRGVVLEKRVHVHDPSGRAEAALRTISVSDRLLNRVQALLYTAQSLRVHNVAARPRRTDDASNC